MSESKRVILGVTGSIAAYKSADITRRLIEKGFRVSVVMTRAAENFITPLTLSSLCGEAVYCDGSKQQKNAWQMSHISLAAQADVLLIAPATANIISKIACGLADDFLTCIALGTKAKILIAPAMNTQMYQNKIVQDNCSKLKGYGIQFIDPVEGKLACGTIGDGHIADEEAIVRAVEQVI